MSRPAPLQFAAALAALLVLTAAHPANAADAARAHFDPYAFVTDPHQIEVAKMLVRYFEDMSRPPPFHPAIDNALAARRRAIREALLKAVALDPLPERVSLDLHQSPPLEHPWCSVRKLHYQIWPGIYSEAFLYLPKEAGDTPRPVILSLTGHWPNGKAYADEQTRCLNFARLGYIVLAPDQNHYEDLPIGISHQTHMVWSNIRALDVIESLPGVDMRRIGACGGSGGGYQAQMLLALDERIKAATIMGFTCDYRETVFPHVASCTCLHFPGALTIADMPEVSAMGLPTPVQYLIMDDYTKHFRDNAFPAIKDLYARSGHPDNVECLYWPTEHVYDKPKRQATYLWMERWLKGSANTHVDEPETTTFPIPRLLALDTRLPAATKKLEELSSVYTAAHKYAVPEIATKAEWSSYRDEQIRALTRLLGMDAALPIASQTVQRSEVADIPGISVASFDLPVEAALRIPVTILQPASGGPFKPVILCSGGGRKRLLAESGANSAVEMARSGRMVAVPDLRFFGDIDLDHLIGTGPTSLMTFVPAYSQDKWLCNQDYSFSYHIHRAWQRNAILWNRPLVGMMVTDIQALVDHLQQRGDADMSQLEIIGRPSSEDPDFSVPLAALFAAGIDSRLKQVDVDLGGRSFEQRNLPAIPFILWHGDILQWAACVADRMLILRNLSENAGDPTWLKGVFSKTGNGEGLQIITRQ